MNKPTEEQIDIKIKEFLLADLQLSVRYANERNKILRKAVEELGSIENEPISNR